MSLQRWLKQSLANCGFRRRSCVDSNWHYRHLHKLRQWIRHMFEPAKTDRQAAYKAQQYLLHQTAGAFTDVAAPCCGATMKQLPVHAGVADQIRSEYTPLDTIRLCRNNGTVLKQFGLDECSGGTPELIGVSRQRLQVRALHACTHACMHLHLPCALGRPLSAGCRPSPCCMQLHHLTSSGCQCVAHYAGPVLQSGWAQSQIAASDHDCKR